MKQILCKLCKKKVKVRGYLHICNNSECKAFSWSKNLFSILKKGRKFYNLVDDIKEGSKKKELTQDFKNILEEAEIPLVKTGQNFVYQIKLKKTNQETYLKTLIEEDKKNTKKTFYQFYVGKTSRHPLERYLRHIIGYQSGKKIVYSYGMALVKYEGPLKSDEATKREKTLADHLRLQGFTVYQN